eukprot:6191630-Pleurochrysis_carterae.AAC.1
MRGTLHYRGAGGESGSWVLVPLAAGMREFHGWSKGAQCRASKRAIAQTRWGARLAACTQSTCNRREVWVARLSSSVLREAGAAFRAMAFGSRRVGKLRRTRLATKVACVCEAEEARAACELGSLILRRRATSGGGRAVRRMPADECVLSVKSSFRALRCFVPPFAQRHMLRGRLGAVNDWGLYVSAFSGRVSLTDAMRERCSRNATECARTHGKRRGHGGRGGRRRAALAAVGDEAAGGQQQEDSAHALDGGAVCL